MRCGGPHPVGDRQRLCALFRQRVPLEAIGATFIGTTLDANGRPNVPGTLIGSCSWPWLQTDFFSRGSTFTGNRLARAFLIFLVLAASFERGPRLPSEVGRRQQPHVEESKSAYPMVVVQPSFKLAPSPNAFYGGPTVAEVYRKRSRVKSQRHCVESAQGISHEFACPDYSMWICLVFACLGCLVVLYLPQN